MKTKTLSPLATRIYKALNGEFLDRKGQEAKCKHGRKDLATCKREETHSVTKFHSHFPNKGDTWGIDLGRRYLEALVLIPEDEGVITKLQRVYHSGGAVGGFYTPTYKEEGIEAIFGAFMKKISESKDIYEYRWITIVLETVLPNEIYRLLNILGQEAMAEGVKNFKWKDSSPGDQEGCFGAGIARLTKIGFTGIVNTELLKAIWEKAKTSPSGYLDDLAWTFIIRYLMEVNPEIATCCKYIRRSIPNYSLGKCLRCFPTSKADINPRDQRQVCVPSKEDQKIVLDLVEKAING